MAQNITAHLHPENIHTFTVRSHKTVFGADFVTITAEKSFLLVSLELQPFLRNHMCMYFYSKLRCRVRFVSP